MHLSSVREMQRNWLSTPCYDESEHGIFHTTTWNCIITPLESNAEHHQTSHPSRVLDDFCKVSVNYRWSEGWTLTLEESHSLAVSHSQTTCWLTKIKDLWKVHDSDTEDLSSCATRETGWGHSTNLHCGGPDAAVGRLREILFSSLRTPGSVRLVLVAVCRRVSSLRPSLR